MMMMIWKGKRQHEKIMLLLSIFDVCKFLNRYKRAIESLMVINTF